MDTAQWAQGIGVIKPMETSSKPPMLERRTRPQKDQALNCPRCNSTNTKFCYYNNYSLSQPRYFCKTCRRYWTEGGSLRNVPVGGGSRKNKRSSSSSSSSCSTTVPLPAPAVKKLPVDLTTPNNFPNQSVNSQNPPKIQYQGQDLNLAYPPPDQDYNNSISKFIENPYNHNPTSSSQLSAMEILKTGISSSKGLNSLFPMSVTSSDSGNIYNSAGFTNLQEFKPTGLNFNLEGLENGYGGISGIQEGSAGARMLFPIEDLKQVPSNNTSEFDHHQQQNRSQGDHNNHSTGYWSGMLGGGSW